MNQIVVEIPDKLAAEMQPYLKRGWFVSEQELLRAALRDFLRRNRLELIERFQEEDIAWAFEHGPLADRSQ